VSEQKPRQSLAANVRRRRERLGISQEDLADRAQLDTRFVRRVEASRGIDVRISTLAKLARALGCTPGALLRHALPVVRRPGRPKKQGRLGKER
jgi:transcriptional regulator with XRE-family HTH domain